MFGRFAWIALGIAMLSIVPTASCSLDDRALAPRASLAGAAGLADPGAAGADAGRSAGESGSEQLPPLPDCDYGNETATGCETLVSNPGFAKDTEGWLPEMGSISMTWNSSDADANAASGSLSVVNALSGEADGIAARGVSQCLSVTAGDTYRVAADVFVPKGQGDGLDGGTFVASAGLSLIFYSDVDCQGFTVTNTTSDVVAEPEKWAHREAQKVAPQGASSMAVRLATFKNFREFTFEARFDNVLVRAN